MLEPITNIKNLIPQKDPFIMVDALQSHTKDKAISSFKIQKDNILFYRTSDFISKQMLRLSFDTSDAGRYINLVTYHYLLFFLSGFTNY